MNRISRIALVLLLVTANVGCQQCLARFRGARCRTGLSFPSLRLPRARAQAQAPVPCTDGCNPDYVSEQGIPSGYISNGPVIETGPIGQDYLPNSVERPYYNDIYSQNRPVVTDSMVSGGIVSGSIVPGSVVTSGSTVGNGNVMVVPGPESAPLPLN